MANYFLGFAGGSFLMLMIATMDNKAAKQECELNLPRTQKCILVAIPEANNEALNNHTADSDSADW